VTPAEAGYPEPPERIFTGSDDELSVFLPVVGSVRAGMPQPPLEDIREYYSIDRNVARSGGTFFLQVKGDSMINAAIRDGDLALIRPQETARNRDIVVALVDGEATLKRFYSDKKQIRLQPENPNYEPIIITADCRDIAIVGRVVGIYRNLE
jgi:repressor LexA